MDEEVEPEGGADADEDSADDALPIGVGRVQFRERLTKARSVQILFLLDREFSPVASLFLTYCLFNIIHVHRRG